MSKDGGPAFPTRDSGVVIGGMSLRDWFAGLALHKIAMFDTTSYPAHQALQAKAAYDIADAMLQAREK